MPDALPPPAGGYRGILVRQLADSNALIILNFKYFSRHWRIKKDDPLDGSPWVANWRIAEAVFDRNLDAGHCFLHQCHRIVV